MFQKFPGIAPDAFLLNHKTGAVPISFQNAFDAFCQLLFPACLCLDHIPHIALSFAFSLLSGAQWVCFAIPEPPSGCPDSISIHPMFHLSSDHDIDHRQLTPCAFDSYSAPLNALSCVRIRHALILEDLCLCEV